jgi:MFS family permease
MTDIAIPTLTRDRSTWFLYLHMAAFGYFLYCFGPSVALLGDDLGVGNAVAGLHSTAYAAAGVLIALLGDRPMRRFGRGPTLWAGCGLLNAGVLVYCVAGTPAVSLSAALLCGFGAFLIVNVAGTALADHHGPTGGPSALSEANGLAAGVGMVAPLLIGGLDSGPGWRWAMAVVPLLFGTLALTLGRTRVPDLVPFHANPPAGKQPAEATKTPANPQSSTSHRPEAASQRGTLQAHATPQARTAPEVRATSRPGATTPQTNTSPQAGPATRANATVQPGTTPEAGTTAAPQAHATSHPDTTPRAARTLPHPHTSPLTPATEPAIQAPQPAAAQATQPPTPANRPVLPTTDSLPTTGPLPTTDAPLSPTDSLPTAYWWAWLLVVCAVAVEFSLSLWAASLLHDRTGLSDSTAATAMTGVVAGLCLGRLAGGRLALRVALHRLYVAAVVVNLVGFILFWTATAPWQGFLGLFVSGLGMSVQFPLATAAAIRAAGGRADLAVSRLAVATTVAAGGAPFLLGLATDHMPVRAAFLLLPVLLLASIPILWKSNGGSAMSSRRAGRP